MQGVSAWQRLLCCKDPDTCPMTHHGITCPFLKKGEPATIRLVYHEYSQRDGVKIVLRSDTGGFSLGNKRTIMKVK